MAAVIVAVALAVAGGGTAYAAEDGPAYAIAGGGTALPATTGGPAYITAGDGMGYAMAAVRMDPAASGGTVGTASGGTAGTPGGGAGPATGTPGTCEYWTSDEGVSAVAVTSGANCGTKSFTIRAAPYEGAVFSDLDGETAYNSFLSQIDEFIYGPASAPAPFGGQAPSVSGLKMIGSADNAFTNHVAVYLYEGPGDANDGAAQELDELIHNTFDPQS